MLVSGVDSRDKLFEHVGGFAHGGDHDDEGLIVEVAADDVGHVAYDGCLFL